MPLDLDLRLSVEHELVVGYFATTFNGREDVHGDIIFECEVS
jgi:hypothetical protein